MIQIAWLMQIMVASATARCINTHKCFKQALFSKNVWIQHIKMCLYVAIRYNYWLEKSSKVHVKIEKVYCLIFAISKTTYFSFIASYMHQDHTLPNKLKDITDYRTHLSESIKYVSLHFFLYLVPMLQTEFPRKLNSNEMYHHQCTIYRPRE